MDASKLNEWAANFVGEDDDMVPEAVAGEWYTKNPGAAIAVLVKCANEDCEIELEIEDGKVEVKCDEAVETGVIDDLALLIVTACYRCMNG